MSACWGTTRFPSCMQHGPYNVNFIVRQCPRDSRLDSTTERKDSTTSAAHSRGCVTNSRSNQGTDRRRGGGTQKHKKHQHTRAAPVYLASRILEFEPLLVKKGLVAPPAHFKMRAT